MKPLNLESIERDLCRAEGGEDACRLCERTRALIAALRAVLSTDPDELQYLMDNKWRRDDAVAVLAYLAQKAGVATTARRIEHGGN